MTAIRPGGDRREVGAGLVVKAGVRAVDPVAAPVLLLALELQLVAVDALAEARHLDAAGLAGRDVDVEQRRRRQRHVLDALHQPRDEIGGDLEAEAAVEAVVERSRAGLLGDGDRRQPEHDALQRRGDGARVGDVVAEVRAVVDPRDDEVGLEVLDQPEAAPAARSRPACRRSRSRPCRRRTAPRRPTAAGAW